MAAEDAEEYGGGDPLAMDAADLEAALDEALQRQADPLIHDTPGSRREQGQGKGNDDIRVGVGIGVGLGLGLGLGSGFGFGSGRPKLYATFVSHSCDD